MSASIESAGLMTASTRPPQPAFAPLVSIVIPVYNRLEYLDLAIESALQQTHGNIEVQVVDDGSAIDLRPVVSRHEGRVQFVCKENGGVATRATSGSTAPKGRTSCSWTTMTASSPARSKPCSERMGDRPGNALGSRPIPVHRRRRGERSTKSCAGLRLRRHL